MSVNVVTITLDAIAGSILYRCRIIGIDAPTIAAFNKFPNIAIPMMIVSQKLFTM